MSDIAQQAEYYDDRWAVKQYADRLSLVRATAVLEALQQVPWTDPPHIVDVGCGTGVLSGILSAFGPTTGLDLSPAAIESAQSRFPEVKFVAIDLSAWSPPVGTYDVAVSVEVLEHMEDQVAHARLLYQMLRPGGHLILTTPNRLTLDAMGERAKTWSTQPIENWLSVHELRELLVSTGFRLRSVGTIVGGFGERGIRRLANSYKVRRLMRRAGMLRSFDAMWLRAGYGLHTVVLAQRV